jgi:hypothetical protein
MDLLVPLTSGKRVKVNSGDVSQQTRKRHWMFNKISIAADERPQPKLRRSAKRSFLGLYFQTHFGHEETAGHVNEQEPVSPGTVAGPKYEGSVEPEFPGTIAGLEYGCPTVLAVPQPAELDKAAEQELDDQAPKLPEKSAHRAVALHDKVPFPLTSESRGEAERKANESHMRIVRKAGAMVRVHGTLADGCIDVQRDLDELKDDLKDGPDLPYQPSTTSRKRAATCMGCETKDQHKG